MLEIIVEFLSENVIQLLLGAGTIICVWIGKPKTIEEIKNSHSKELMEIEQQYSKELAEIEQQYSKELETMEQKFTREENKKSNTLKIIGSIATGLLSIFGK